MTVKTLKGLIKNTPAAVCARERLRRLAEQILKDEPNARCFAAMLFPDRLVTGSSPDFILLVDDGSNMYVVTPSPTGGKMAPGVKRLRAGVKRYSGSGCIEDAFSQFCLSSHRRSNGTPQRITGHPDQVILGIVPRPKLEDFTEESASSPPAPSRPALLPPFFQPLRGGLDNYNFFHR